MIKSFRYLIYDHLIYDISLWSHYKGGNYVERLCASQWERTRRAFVREQSFVPERSIEKLTIEKNWESQLFSVLLWQTTQRKLKKITFSWVRGKLNSSCFFAFWLRSEQEPCFDQNPENRNKTASCSLVLWHNVRRKDARLSVAVKQGVLRRSFFDIIFALRSLTFA